MRCRLVRPGVFSAFCALILAGSGSQVAKVTAAEVASGPVSAAALSNMAKVAKAEQQFALNLYTRMAEGANGENLFFSPLSIHSVLAMTAEGAAGKTAEEMAEVLGLELKDNPASSFASSHQGLATLASALRGDGGKESHTLLTANALWVDKSYPLAVAFQQALKPYLRGAGGVFACDFHNRYPAEAERVDRWCCTNTKGYISSVMPKLSPQEARQLHLVLTSAVYFEGKWVKPFEPKDTRQETFYLAGGKEVPTAMMRSWHFSQGRYGAVDAAGKWFDTPTTYNPDQPLDEQHLYPEGKGFTMAELPYKGERLSMLLIAPRDRDALDHVEKLLTAERLSGWIEKMESRTLLRLRLPQLDLATEYKLGEQLASLGMKRALTNSAVGEGADFSRMVASSDPNLQLYLSLIIHKAILKADEQGTVAAAVTGVFPPPAAAAQPETTLPFHPNFDADRPFLMLIRDKPTGAILFMGRINDPRTDS
jgi:serpin B